MPQFRVEDLAVLVGILGTDPEAIERRLIALTGCSTATARRFRRLLLISVATLPVLGFASEANANESGPGAGAPIDISVEAATSSAPSSEIPPAQAPTTAPPTSEPAADEPELSQASAPTARAMAVLPPGAEATVSIARLGIQLPIVQGGQAVIDEGIAAHYTATGWLAPTPPGAAGTYWLAAHHHTHGNPFAALPDVADGDTVEVTTATNTFTYTVTSKEVVGIYAGYGPVYGRDPGAAVILLQTCLDGTRRLLVHGSLTATT